MLTMQSESLASTLFDCIVNPQYPIQIVCIQSKFFPHNTFDNGCWMNITNIVFFSLFISYHLESRTIDLVCHFLLLVTIAKMVEKQRIGREKKNLFKFDSISFQMAECPRIARQSVLSGLNQPAEIKYFKRKKMAKWHLKTVSCQVAKWPSGWLLCIVVDSNLNEHDTYFCQICKFSNNKQWRTANNKIPMNETWSKLDFNFEWKDVPSTPKSSSISREVQVFLQLNEMFSISLYFMNCT